MNKRVDYLLSLITLIAASLFLASHPVLGQSALPDFGVIWNDDADLAITSADPGESGQVIEYIVNLLAGTPVKTLAYSVGAGSDVLVYPTKVASTWGWRRTSYDDKSRWGARIRKGRALAAADFDAVRIAGEQAKEIGLFFFPSYRMNDDHFMFDPLAYPLTGKFWMDHQQYAIKNSGKSPIISDDHYAELFDYSHEAVRQYRMDVLFEIIDRYHDIMDGIELDFTRVWVLFPKGQARAKAHLITEMIEKLRAKLDEKASENNRKYYLMIRVPTQLESCSWAGLDVRQWMKKDLVDIIVPSQLMTTAFEKPIDEFVALARNSDCKIYANMYPRVGWERPFVANPTVDTYAGSVTRIITNDMVRAMAANSWHLGADGIYFYNVRYQEGADNYFRKFRDVAGPECISGHSKLYPITKAYYLDHEDNYTYKKQLPLTMQSDKEHTLKLMVGEDFDTDKTKVKLQYCGLRLGFRGLTSDYDLEVAVNGNTLSTGPAGDKLIKVTGNAPDGSGAMAPAAKAFWQIEIKDTNILRQGFNDITIKTEQKTTLTDVNLGVIYDNNLSDMLFR